MTKTKNDASEFLRDLFHNCALVAFVEEARAQGTWPDCEATRQRAFALYEQELHREKNSTASHSA